MKNYNLLNRVALCIAIASVTAMWIWNAQATPGKAAGPEAFSKAVFHVEGMSCGGCEATIKGALSGTEGIKDIIVNISEQTVEIYYDENPVTDVKAMGENALGKRIKVAGHVAAGSIKGSGRTLSFTLEQNEVVLPVRYTGSSPVPDTFKDGTQAVVEGIIRDDGTFEADKIQAKCASKYEAEYGTPGDDSR